jgi:hypothetical protein
MAKICKNCNFSAADDAVFCPACGTVFSDDGGKTQSANQTGRTPSDAQRPYAQPVNAASGRHYSQPLQAQVKPAPMAQPPYQAPRPEKPKKTLQYILIGVGLAAVVFTVALIIILNSGKSSSTNTPPTVSTPSPTTATPTTATPTTVTPTDELIGTYTWVTNDEDATGSLVIYSDYSGLFTYDGKGTVNMTFDPEDESVEYTGADGQKYDGEYELDGDTLRITTDGYVDTFTKQ